MKEINLLPDNLLQTQSVRLVQSWYAAFAFSLFFFFINTAACKQMIFFVLNRYMQSFQEILEFKDKNADDEKVTYE